jgi:hypothetical protein
MNTPLLIRIAVSGLDCYNIRKKSRGVWSCQASPGVGGSFLSQNEKVNSKEKREPSIFIFVPLLSNF